MASSSVSQESLDHDDFEFAARRSRVRQLRTRTTPPHKQGDGEAADRVAELPDSADYNPPPLPVPLPDHESPNRTAPRCLKDKRGRPNHLHKGKTAKDKRKLREKRRSTGVVHMPSTESTGDSLDDEDEEKCPETRKNTSYNEVIDADNPQTPEEVQLSRSFTRSSRNKSPSDLEADLEDNQDYDSTVSQSETNLTVLTGSTLSASTAHKTAMPRHISHMRPVSYPSRVVEQDLQLDTAYMARPAARPPSHNREVIPHKTRLSSCNSARSNSTESDEARLTSRIRELEQALQKETDEKAKLLDKNSQLMEMLRDRDQRIAQLEKDVLLFQQDLRRMDEEGEEIYQENLALIRALQSLSTSV